MTIKLITEYWTRISALLLFGLALSCGGAPTPEAVPLDPAVRTGKLDNGLTYYIRKNTKPEKRVEMRLVVNAGSIQEDEDQRGAAHFVEHLGFRGTRRFPGDTLIHYLQSVGANVGPDVNAHTGFDETLYSLTVPSDTMEGVRRGLDILGDWAGAVSFVPAEIDKERGVVLEEWRLGRGAEQRMSDKIIPVLFKDSKYARRLPIGTKEAIEGIPSEALRRFYHDWYRPDNMAVVIVGDIDPGQIEAALRAEFRSRPEANEIRTVTPVPVPAPTAPRYAIVSDKETPFNTAAVIWITNPQENRTTSDYRRGLTEKLFLQMLNLRLAELKQQADPPFLQAQAGYGRLMIRAKEGFQLGVVVADGGIGRGLASAYAEVVRVQRHGFTAPELERAKATLLQQIEQVYRERDKTPSARLADLYVQNYLYGDPAPGPEFDHAFAQSHVAGITLEDVNGIATRWLTPVNRVFVAKTVEKPGVVPPTEQTLSLVVKTVEASKLKPYGEKKLEGGLLATRPRSGKLIASKPLAAIGATELSFENGIRVILKPTAFQNDQILLSGFRPGGQSVFPDDYNLTARLAAGYSIEAGVGPFSKSELQKRLAGKSAMVAPILSTYFDGIKGQSSAADFETMLQLVYLYFTEPRADAGAFDSFLNRNRAILHSVLANPTYNFFNEALKFRYKNYRRHPNVLPTDADWAGISLDKVMEVDRERFGNAAGYTFEIVGSFDPKAVAPLIATYLGGLPSKPRHESWKDLGIRAVEGPLAHTIRLGADPKSIVQLSIEGPADWNLPDVHRFWALGNILQRTCLDQLRRQMGGIYGLQITAALEKTPYGHFSFLVTMPCAPGNVTKLGDAIFREIERMQAKGPTAEEIQQEVESERRTFEKDATDNSAWLWKLETIYRDEEPLTRLAHPDQLVALVTPADLQAVAHRYLDTRKFVQVTLLPETHAGAPAKSE